MQFNEQIEFLIDNCIATEDEITLVMNVAGRSEEVINSIIYARTGYHDIEQYIECEF